jgi:hypothetical protein
MEEKNINLWKKYLIRKSNQGIFSINLKGGNVKNSKLTAILFLKEKMNTSGDNLINKILSVSSKNESIQKKDNTKKAYNEELDEIGMIGHEIGIIENSNQFQEYLKRLNRILKKGQVLISAYKSYIIDREQNIKSTFPFSMDSYGIQTVHELENNVILGPYFGMVYFDINIVKTSLSKTMWKIEVIDERKDSYIILLY